MFVGSALVEQASDDLPAEAWVRYRHAKERMFGQAMPPLLLAATLVTGAAAALSASKLGYGAAFVMLLSTFGVTGAVCAP